MGGLAIFPFYWVDRKVGTHKQLCPPFRIHCVLQDSVLPVVVRAEAQGAAAAVAAALERLAAQRDSMGVWRLCSAEAAQLPEQEAASEFLQGEGALAAEPELAQEGNAGHHSNLGISSGTGEKAEPAFRRVHVLRALAGECGAQDVHSCMDEEKRGGVLVAFATKLSKEAKVCDSDREHYPVCNKTNVPQQDLCVCHEVRLLPATPP